MNALKTACACGLLLLIGAAAGADEPPAPQLTAEHKTLESWIGGWSGEGEMKPGPFGEGGPVTWTEDCTWFESSPFHVACTSEGSGPMGPMKGLGIIGYNSEKGVFTHYGVDSTGWAGYSEGTRDGGTWRFESEEMMGGTTYHTRFTMTMQDNSSMTFSWEMSEDGEKWIVLMDGTSTKQ